MSMEETAVLLSIRPEWCQKIFRGEKTMEIRKSFPKDFQGQPFKCFIYCRYFNVFHYFLPLFT